ncbi:putative lipoprotein [Fusobacterium necrophorum subsp. funduliforme Fnf 1007]|uniref:Lipoprotein n=2 Tax=Fusobacterium necrophorum TaxID=859 RepID=A0AAN3VTQ5_9FUSO|nr:putative lipoprotein [Fusobacterium necrophorum subsp. funduliforme Fnf 1007]
MNMKKMMFLGLVVLLGISFSSCGTTNTRIRPYAEAKQEVQDLKAIVTRADRSGIYLALKNVSEGEMEILWEDSRLGGDKVSHGTYLDANDYQIKQENTVLKAGEIFQTVLHRKGDMYYLDPVLYQPGGVKVKALEYPVILDLKVRQGMGVSSLEVAIQQEESLYQKDVEARLQGAKDGNYIPEFTEETIEVREDKKVIKRF